MECASEHRDNIIEERQRFYKEMLEMKVSLCDVPIPTLPPGVTTPVVPLVFHHDITSRFKNRPIERLFALSRLNFGGGKYTKRILDEDIIVNDRDFVTCSYAILTVNKVEIECGHTVSADEWASAKLYSLTLAERLFFGLYYYWKSGGHHLDCEGATLCEASRDVSDEVPCVSFQGGVHIELCSPAEPKNFTYPRQVWF